MRTSAIALIFLATIFSAMDAASVCNGVPGAEKLWAKPDTHFILFGEMHGTAEGPKLVGEAVCAALMQGKIVTVGLEYPQSQRQALEAYMVSKGSPADRAALLSGKHWRGFSDGRGSQAMLDLIERLRKLRSDGANLSVVAFVPDLAPHSTPAQYEADMAAVLAQVPKTSLVMALMGNIHARVSADFGGGHTLGYQPMAVHLPPDQVIAVNMTAIHGGAAWNCLMPSGNAELDCSAHSLEGYPVPSGVTLLAGPTNGFHATLGFDTATASPPAVGAAK